jgi:hypothetical protein
MNDGQYCSQRSDCLEFSVEQAFQPDCQPAIRAWLTDAKTAQTQKEALLQALLDFDDDCGGFYRARSFLLAAEYLALCPDCRQGDLIVDRLLKLSYGYFRVEKADWCMPPEAFVRSARETLARSDLGRVVPRFEALIQQTESRAVMRHAARELLRIQPGNRCGIAAIGFDKLLRPQPQQWFQGKQYTNPMMVEAWQSLVEEPIQSDASAQAISQVLLLCSKLNEGREALQCEALQYLFQLAPEHPVSLAYLWRVTLHLNGFNSHSLSEENQQVLQSKINHLWQTIYKANPNCLITFTNQVEQWHKEYEESTYWIIDILGKSSKGSQTIAHLLASVLDKISDTASPERYCDIVVDALVNTEVYDSVVIHSLSNLFKKIEHSRTKYEVAIALAKIDPQQLEAITWIQNALQEIIHSKFTTFLSSLFCDWTVYKACEKALSIDQTQETAVEVLRHIVEQSAYLPACNILHKIPEHQGFVVKSLIQKLRDEPKVFRNHQNHLRKFCGGNLEVIEIVKQALENTEDLQILIQGAELLPDLSCTISVALEVSRRILTIYRSSEKPSFQFDDRDIPSFTFNDYRYAVFNATKMIILHDTNTSQQLYDLLQCLDANSIIRITESLHQTKQGSSHLLLHILEKSLEDKWPERDGYNWRSPGIYTPIVDWLEVFPDDELAKVVTALRDRLTHPSDELHHTYHAIVWQCAQRLPHATFHQAWHTCPC